MIDKDLAFPVLAFHGEDDDMEGFLAWNTFTSCCDYDLDYRVGMLLVDREGRSFRVASFTKLARTGGFWRRLLDTMNGIWRVEHQLSDEGAISFEALQQRVCNSITANPDHWRDDEAIAGEDGPPVEEEVLLEALRERVRKSRSLKEIMDVLQFDV